jgi:predicted metal-dependent phosphoesterase TrpH
MLIKASLHVHTKEDVIDGKIINYNIYELIDHAHKFGFGVLAITTHQKCIVNDEHLRYASEKNILILPGIELAIDKRLFIHQDVVLFSPEINFKTDAEQIKNYEDLKKFKIKYSDAFILAVHPNFGRFESMGARNLEKNIKLFDGIELSWFYSKKFDLNKKSLDIAKKYHKPIIATSDAHVLDYFSSDYCEIECQKLEGADIIRALKNGSIINHSRPKKFFDLIRIFGQMKLKDYFYNIILWPFNFFKHK